VAGKRMPGDQQAWSGMEMLQRMRTLVRNLFRRDGVERELEAEVRSFAALLEEEQMLMGSARTKLAVPPEWAWAAQSN